MTLMWYDFLLHKYRAKVYNRDKRIAYLENMVNELNHTIVQLREAMTPNGNGK